MLALTWVEVSKVVEALEGAKVAERAALESAGSLKRKVDAYRRSCTIREIQTKGSVGGGLLPGQESVRRGERRELPGLHRPRAAGDAAFLTIPDISGFALSSTNARASSDGM